MNLPWRCSALIRTLVAVSGLAVTLAPLGLASSTHAQSSNNAIRATDFGGARFPLEATSGDLAFAAQRVYSTDTGTLQRLILVGDVRVRIGRYDFYAKRAAVWVQPIDGGALQVYTYFEELGKPDELATAAGFAAEKLPVKAIIIPDRGATLAADLVLSRLPGSSDPAAHREFVERSEAALARSLGLAPPPAPIEQKPILEPDFVERRAKEREAWLASGKPALESLPPLPLRDFQTTIAQEQPKPVGPVSPGTQPQPRSTAAARQPSAGSAQPVPRSAPSTAAAAAAGAGTGSTSSTTKSSAGTIPAVATSSPNSGPPPTRTAGGGVEPIFVKEGVITLAPGNVTFVSGEDEDAVMATGGVAMQYATADGRVLQLTSQRAVVFLAKGGVPAAMTFSAGDVRGIYLEGDVIASDGQYTLRGPQIFYDVVRNKAVSIDSVFWTYDEQRKLPVYVRAKAIRQESATQFVAERAKFTNSAFFEPELSIGASTVTITRQLAPADSGGLDGPNAPAQTRTIVQATDIVPRLAGVPFFYWPKYSGDPANRPLKDFRYENYSGSGSAIKVTLNAYALLGKPRPKNFEADVLLDYYFERGLGLGTRLRWKNPDNEGGFFAYGILDDTGIDIMKPGTKITRDGEFRGIVLLEHRHKIDDKWALTLDGAWLSDEAVVDAFFEGLGETRREFTSRIAATRRSGNTLLTLEAKGNLNDFISNEYLLQSQGYSVTKFPEAVYSRLGDDLLTDYPGRLTYFSEYRAGYLSMKFDEKDARDHGFTSNSLAQRAFGIDANQSLSDTLSAAGYIDDSIFRADTRHELVAKLNAGPVIFTPFVVVRGTAYDQEFEDFAPGESGEGRIWSSMGVRASTTIQRVYDSVGSRILDIHRIRHIIEPNAAIFVSGTTLESDALPVYDENVESLADGTMMKVGVTQTFQTQRGGPGRWHNTDLLILKTDFVSSSDDAPRNGPLGTFIDYRPELSNPGNFFDGEMLWRVTDALAVTGSTIFDFDKNQQATSAAGLLLRHAPNFVTATEIRYLNEQNDTIVTFGAQYRLTDKYSAFLGANYDVDEGGFQSTGFEVRRRFQSLEFGVNLSYNDITGESSFGFMFRPYGASESARLSGLGSANPTAATSPTGF